MIWKTLCYHLCPFSSYYHLQYSVKHVKYEHEYSEIDISDSEVFKVADNIINKSSENDMVITNSDKTNLRTYFESRKVEQ